MATCEVRLIEDEKTTLFKEQLLARAAQNDEEYYFMDDNVQELLGRTFTCHDVEVRYVFGPELDFSLLIDDSHFIVDCEFAAIEDLQIFFAQQRKLITLQVSSFAISVIIMSS